MKRSLSKIVRKLLKQINAIDLSLQREIAEPPQTQLFSYKGPREVGPNSKEVVTLAKNPRISCSVQVVKETTPDNLHSHQTIDGFWFVLQGRARFHGENGVLGEFGPQEGILTPRNFKYWYESIGDCDLEMIQILAIDEVQGWHRCSYVPDNYDRSLIERSDHRISGN